MSVTSGRRRVAELEAEREELRARLFEAEQTIDAIRGGHADALIIDGPDGERVFSLTGADRPYRTLIEQMQEGAVNLRWDGTIQYCNKAFAELLRRPLETIIGTGMVTHIEGPDRPGFTSVLKQCRVDRTHTELNLCDTDDKAIPVHVSLTPVDDNGHESVGMVVTDLRERKQAERTLLSAQFVRRLIEEASVGIAVVDDQFRFVLANPSYRTLAGANLIVGRRIGEVFAEPIVQLLESLVAQVVANGQPLRVPERCIPGADATWWNISLVPLVDEGTNALSVLILTDDISEEKAAALRVHEELERNLRERQHWQAQLQTSEDRLRMGLAAVEAGVFDWDISTGKVVWTDETYPLLALQPESGAASYELWRRHVHPDDIEDVEAAAEKAVQSGERYYAEYRVIRADGVERWVSSSGLVIAREGQTKRMIGAMVDITERKEAEERLRLSREALREADRRKDEFLATLAHELRNPLAPIRAAAEILGAPGVTPQQLQWAQNVIHRQVGQTALLLDDLLDIARITQGKLELKLRRVSLTEVVESAVEAARPLVDRKRHTLAVTLPEGTLTLEADPLRLSQVLSNLLTNAAKYTEPGGRIELTGLVEADTLRLSVKDNGIGIPRESLAHIFEMFSQVDGAKVRSDGGLGIGLALVKGLLDLQGGWVAAKSDGPGHGSEFSVHLPLRGGHHSDEAVPSPVAHVKGRGRRVLVADDNRDAADALAMFLELAGHEVRVAHDGRAALSTARTFRPDVALLDIGMPELSGYEVARALRREPWGATTELIALTGWGQADDRNRAKDAGFDTHLTKPIDPTALEAFLSRPAST